MKQLDWTSGELAEGLRCYRAEEFFAAHEHWELVWLRLQEPEKTFLQGVIQVAAAFYHFQRGNLEGTASLLRGALRRLNPCLPNFGGISLTPLCEEIRRWLKTLEDDSQQSSLPFPHIEIDDEPWRRSNF